MKKSSSPSCFRKKTTKKPQKTELEAQAIPAKKFHKLDIEIKALVASRWQDRRMVVTKDKIYFSLFQEDSIRDLIPLHEVASINIKKEDSQSEGDIEDETSKMAASAYRFFHAFQIETIEDGYNCGRTYHIQAGSQELCNQIVDLLRRCVKKAAATAFKSSLFEKSQKKMLNIHNSTMFQLSAAFFIILNFAMSVLAAEVSLANESNGIHDPTFDFMNTVDFVFVLIFTIELLVNLYAHWLKPFLSNPWSVFDAAIVSLSLLSLAPIGLPLRTMLLLRCLRVLRIFGKLKAVVTIFTALFRSLMPVANTFLIIFVIASIYAIIGVAYLSDEAPDQFHTFSRAFVCMFRLTSGSVEWWFDRFPPFRADESINWLSTTFYITYVMLVNWFIFQVSLAILLDNFRSSQDAERERKLAATIERNRRAKQLTSPLDPLILRLSKDFSDQVDLSKRLKQLFKVLDADNLDFLDSEKFRLGLRKLHGLSCSRNQLLDAIQRNPIDGGSYEKDFNPCINLSDSDYIGMTAHLGLQDGCLREADFEALMLEHLKLYTQARLSNMSEFWVNEERDFTVLGTLKHLMLDQLAIRADQSRICSALLQSTSAAGKDWPPFRGASHRGNLAGGNSTAVSAIGLPVRSSSRTRVAVASLGSVRVPPPAPLAEPPGAVRARPAMASSVSARSYTVSLQASKKSGMRRSVSAVATAAGSASDGPTSVQSCPARPRGGGAAAAADPGAQLALRLRTPRQGSQTHRRHGSSKLTLLPFLPPASEAWTMPVAGAAELLGFDPCFAGAPTSPAGALKSMPEPSTAPCREATAAVAAAAGSQKPLSLSACRPPPSAAAAAAAAPLVCVTRNEDSATFPRGSVQAPPSPQSRLSAAIDKGVGKADGNPGGSSTQRASFDARVAARRQPDAEVSAVTSGGGISDSETEPVQERSWISPPSLPPVSAPLSSPPDSVPASPLLVSVRGAGRLPAAVQMVAAAGPARRGVLWSGPSETQARALALAAEQAAPVGGHAVCAGGGGSLTLSMALVLDESFHSEGPSSSSGGFR